MVGKVEVRAVETREEQKVCVAMKKIKDEWKDKWKKGQGDLGKEEK